MVSYRVVAVVAGNSEAVTLSGLQADTQYQLVVTAVRAGKKYRSRPIVFRTLGKLCLPKLYLSPASRSHVTGAFWQRKRSVHDPFKFVQTIWPTIVAIALVRFYLSYYLLIKATNCHASSEYFFVSTPQVSLKPTPLISFKVPSVRKEHYANKFRILEPPRTSPQQDAAVTGGPLPPPPPSSQQPQPYIQVRYLLHILCHSSRLSMTFSCAIAQQCEDIFHFAEFVFVYQFVHFYLTRKK